VGITTFEPEQARGIKPDSRINGTNPQNREKRENLKGFENFVKNRMDT
jgi:hypothetical protein